MVAACAVWASARQTATTEVTASRRRTRSDERDETSTGTPWGNAKAWAVRELGCAEDLRRSRPPHQAKVLAPLGVRSRRRRARGRGQESKGLVVGAHGPDVRRHPGRGPHAHVAAVTDSDGPCCD